MKNNRIYLAGPDVFRKDAIEHFERLKRICSQYGFEGVTPFDLEEKTSVVIFNNNLIKIANSNFVIANITPFRGCCIDDGTAFEIGYAWRANKTIMAYSGYCDYELKHIVLAEKRLPDEYPVIEDFGKPCNLMIYEALTGPVVQNFEQAIRQLSRYVIENYIK